MGTLLGPERTTIAVLPRVVVSVLLPGMIWPLYRSGEPAPLVGLCSSGFGGGRVVVGWSLVENCTVDASIFVVKLSRANGGCLGTRSR